MCGALQDGEVAEEGEEQEEKAHYSKDRQQQQPQVRTRSALEGSKHGALALRTLAAQDLLAAILTLFLNDIRI